MEKKPSCKDIRLLADEYADGTLSAEESKYFEAHIKECAECRSYLEELLAIKKAASEYNEEIPDGLHSRIMDAVRNEIKQSGSQRRSRALRRTAISAACAAICFIIVLTVALLPFLHGSGSLETPADSYEAEGDSAAGALPGDTQMSEQENTDPMHEATFPSMEAPKDESQPTNDPEFSGSASTAKPDAVPEEDITKSEADEAPLPESAADEILTQVESEHQTPSENHTQSSDSRVENTSAPGGDEITMALLIVSGLLAVASFIAFLISLSSIRMTPENQKDNSHKEE